MSNKNHFGKLQLRIIQTLAEKKGITRNKIAELAHADVTNVVDGVKILQERHLVERAGTEVIKGSSRNLYRLSEEGIAISLVDNIVDLDKLAINYPENPIMIEYRKVSKFAGNSAHAKNLAKKIIRKAAQLTLVQEDREAVTKNPEALLNMAFESIQFFGKLPDQERAAVKIMADQVEQWAAMDPDTNALWDKKKATIRGQAEQK